MELNSVFNAMAQALPNKYRPTQRYEASKFQFFTKFAFLFNITEIGGVIFGLK